jgi:hypothetical protein
VAVQHARVTGSLHRAHGCPRVKPARYRGRYHWITIVEVARFPAGYLTELVEASHQRALDSLSRVKRAAILDLAQNGETRASLRRDAESYFASADADKKQENAVL